MFNVRSAYGNSPASAYTIDFFEHASSGARNAFLASPFFSTIEPIEKLTARGCTVQLLVRLCSITTPSALRFALANPLVSTRYFTDRSFHAKLYIVDDVALIGSANLTEAGLKSNREVSVVLRKDIDPGYNSLPIMFETFWDYADVLDTEILTQYEQAYRKIGRPQEEDEFQRYLETLINPAKPPSAKTGSDKVSKKRAFLQHLRRKYDERLNPAFGEVANVFDAYGLRRQEFSSGDPEIEIGRLLGWLRIVFAPKDSWKDTPLLSRAERKKRIEYYIDEWAIAADTKAGDMFYADQELDNIAFLRTKFSSPETIADLSYDEIFEALSKIHAFYDRLRFSRGGLSGLREQFQSDNPLSRVKSSITYLLYGNGTSLDRAYDCIHDERLSLAGFGEHCVMELVGWMNPDRPPINGRTIKALRFLGFDVAE